MNVSRRLFRAWIFVSVLWLLGTIAYACFVFPSQMADARYQYVYEMQADVDVDDINKIDWNNKSIYELMRSPSLETLTPTFDQLEEQYWSDWDQGIKKGELKKLTYPHGNLYLSADLTQADQSYLNEHFTKQRWRRWMWASLPLLGLILLPPALLFCLGVSLLWVGRGFKRPSM